jgi:UPF0148 protein
MRAIMVSISVNLKSVVDQEWIEPKLSENSTKRMAELLRSGATMLSNSCPECSSPLFKLKNGEIWCAKCERRVVIVSDGEEVTTESRTQLESLERALVEKLVSMGCRLAQEDELERLRSFAGIIDALLNSLETLRKIRKQ